jgi:hypothetical protein
LFPGEETAPAGGGAGWSAVRMAGRRLELEVGTRQGVGEGRMRVEGRRMEVEGRRMAVGRRIGMQVRVRVRGGRMRDGSSVGGVGTAPRAERWEWVVRRHGRAMRGAGRHQRGL